MRDWKSAELSSVDRALCEYAEKLTLSPSEMKRADVDALRAVGLTDEQILNAAATCSYFNFINRMADGLGVDLEPEMR
ncbi:MAG TPA: peroxidase [Myxococcota bacterium]|nr:peroxidase [Myxococcota bacterium]